MTFKFVDRIFKKLGYIPNGTISRELPCAWCGETFHWEGLYTDDRPRFCSTSHLSRAREARRKRKEAASYTAPKPKKAPEPPVDLNMVGRCPTPFKETHRSYEAARETIQRVDPAMHPYRCVCGGIHIGHRKKSKK